MISQERENLIIARFFPKEDVFEQLKNVCQKHNLKTGVVVSSIGQLGWVELGFFKEKGNYMPQRLENPMEVLSISGIVSKNEKDFDFHLHISLSNESKQVFGGHFINGEVSITLEIVILKTDIEVKRKVEQETGLNGLYLD